MFEFMHKLSFPPSPIDLDKGGLSLSDITYTPNSIQTLNVNKSHILPLCLKIQPQTLPGNLNAHTKITFVHSDEMI